MTEERDVSVPTTPTNPNLREQVARLINDECPVWEEQFDAGRGIVCSVSDASLVVAKHFAPVLEGLRAERDAAVIQRDKFGQLHLSEAKTHDETIQSLREAQAEVEQWRATFGETALRDATAIIAERDTLRADRDKERESRVAWALEADRLQQIALQAVAKLEKLRDEQLDRDPGHECDCEDTGECHAVAAHWAYLRALTAVRPATRPASDVPGLDVGCTADEEACVHGQTADLTGLAAREAQS